VKPVIIWATGAALMAVFAVAIWFYNKPHRTADRKPFVSLSAVALFKAFEADEISANENYLDKVVEVHGEVAEVMQDMDGQTVVVFKTEDAIFGVRCTLDQNHSPIQPGDTIHLKGICKGFLSDVVLTNCIQVK
jgi:hypothetical protein